MSEPTRRRAETRRRLIAAASGVFAAKGFGRATVEDVCAAADYTRGAFYSNFDSLDELFFALYEQRAAALVDAVAGALAQSQDRQLADLVRRVLQVLGTDQEWYAVSTEFLVHALRHREVAARLATHRAALRQALVPALLAATAGRALPDAAGTPELLARSIVAIHEGTMNQLVLEPGAAALRDWQLDLILAVVNRPEVEQDA